MGGWGVERGWYKNNNGNSSLGLVPIHRLQPRLLTMSDYCYSDRLRRWVRDPFCNPWLSGFACYSRTFRLSFCPFQGGFPGRSVIQALLHISRSILHQFQITWGRSPSFPEAL